MATNPPCAACKYLRRRCASDCAFAPYFPPSQPHRFVGVHKVFGASNVAKLLARVPPPQRHLAVDSLAYEADARLRDPVHGCVAAISLLQRHLARLQSDVAFAKSQLAQFNLTATTAATTNSSPFSSSSSSSKSSPSALAMAAPAQQPPPPPQQQEEFLLQFGSIPNNSYNKMVIRDHPGHIVALHGLCTAFPYHHDCFQSPSSLAQSHLSTMKEDHIE